MGRPGGGGEGFGLGRPGAAQPGTALRAAGVRV